MYKIFITALGEIKPKEFDARSMRHALSIIKNAFTFLEVKRIEITLVDIGGKK